MSRNCRLQLCMILYICLQIHTVFVLGKSCISLSASRVLCNNIIPEDLTDSVEDVELVDINTKEINIEKDSFAGKGWSQIKRLKITTLNAPLGWLKLRDNTFGNLFSLRSLILFMPALNYIGNQTFVGLDNLTEFELTGCRRLSIFYLSEIMQNVKSMPNLKVMKIDHLNKMGKLPVTLNNFDSEFFKALAIRNITEFYARSMTIGTIDLQSLTLLCGSLQVFDLSRTYIVRIIATSAPCKSLRHLTLNYLSSQTRWGNLDFYNFPPSVSVKLNDKFYFFEDVIKLDFNNFFTNETILKKHFLHIKSFKGFNFKEVSVQNNFLRHIDLVVTADSVFKKVEKLEIQGNTLEYLNGGVFKSAFSLKMLNMSNNRLNVMQKLNTFDFEQMLYHVTSLQTIDLSRNGLTFLPRMIFKNNHNLRHLYLSNNRIEQISLLSSFTLSLIDLKSNAVKFFDEMSRQWFDENFRSDQNDTNFSANIYGNPFQCLCEHQTFLQWIVHTPLVGDLSHNITCADHNHDRITIEMTKELDEDCGRAKRIRDISIVSSITFVIVVTVTLTTIFVYIRRKRRLRQKRTKEEIVAQVQDNNFLFQYPVFVSYSNEDIDVVLGYIYPDLVDHLRRMFDTPRELVCIGDRHFRPGRTIFEEIDACLEKSAVVICAISYQFCQSNFCKYELERAYNLNKKILLVFIEEVEEHIMPPFVGQYFNKYTRINLRRLQNNEILITPKWEVICECILDILAE